MSSLNDLVTSIGADLSREEINRLHVLVSDWQVLSDFALADAVLWVQGSDGRYMAVAQCRPGTGATIHLDDVVGLYASPMRAAQLKQALNESAPRYAPELRWAGSYSVSEVHVPVCVEGRNVAVCSLETSSQSMRRNAESLRWFEEIADALASMLAVGRYPYESAPTSSSHGIPRVSDGAIYLDNDGLVQHITPNARSCFRRLGYKDSLEGRILAEVVTDLVSSTAPVDETLAVVVMGRAAWVSEVESSSGTVSLRALPLFRDGERAGAALLCRDVSEMRRKERELLSKDATIREIHHRVKNNLQTVSALLRMQARRSDNPEVKQALGEAERRVATIAQVHQELSQNIDETVDFDQMMDRIIRMAAQTAAPDQKVTTSLSGTFGRVDADAASALAVVLAELVTNAVEHGFEGRTSGTVTVTSQREDGHTVIHVIDDGTGIDPQAPSTGLGTQIVKTLVSSELHGSIVWQVRESGGTDAVIHAQL
ncbi:MAG: histidine kinase N-terminal domain-containing protein [Actinomycetaceae bacterium]|nr:histidine kinase N-terminal domain-containing protein [Actinomycetaceae bacterium]MDU0970249.1 histidine kinase N-terminal domain-containing protein [Actinomycetaceae bacterium]